MLNRRLVSVLLVIALMFSFSVSAFAEGGSVEDNIVNSSEYLIRDYSGTKTVYISVDIENNPELSDISVIQDVSLGFYEKQAEYDDGTFVLMSQNHIAGELALHVLLFKFFSMLGGSNEGSIFNEYYNGAKVAALNIDENRLNPVIMEMVGVLVLSFGSVSNTFGA